MQLKSRRTFVLCTLAALVTAAVFFPADWLPSQMNSSTQVSPAEQQLN